MTWPLAASRGCIAAENLRRNLAALMAGKTVLAIGPGLGQGGGDGEIHHRAAFGHQDAGGDRRRCAEYSGGETVLLAKLAKGRARWC